MKQIKPFIGKWRIAEMEVWDQNYVDMEVPGYILIGSEGTGQFQFGLVSGDIDGRVEQCGSTPRLEFSWSGHEENDPACGRGWAVIENGRLEGRIYLHLAALAQPDIINRLGELRLSHFTRPATW